MHGSWNVNVTISYAYQYTFVAVRAYETLRDLDAASASNLFGVSIASYTAPDQPTYLPQPENGASPVVLLLVACALVALLAAAAATGWCWCTAARRKQQRDAGLAAPTPLPPRGAIPGTQVQHTQQSSAGLAGETAPVPVAVVVACTAGGYQGDTAVPTYYPGGAAPSLGGVLPTASAVPWHADVGGGGSMPVIFASAVAVGAPSQAHNNIPMATAVPTAGAAVAAGCVGASGWSADEAPPGYDELQQGTSLYPGEGGYPTSADSYAAYPVGMEMMPPAVSTPPTLLNPTHPHSYPGPIGVSPTTPTH